MKTFYHIQFTRWNNYHTQLSRFLHISPLNSSLRLFYNAGAIVGLCGTITAFFALAFTAVNLLATPASPTFNILSKRNAPVVKPIIPGVTVPLSDFPFILFAVIVNQIWHEAGHFLAAALTQIPLRSLTFTLLFIIPTFSTVLSSSHLSALTPFTRIPIITAGAWHNLVLWAILSLLSFAFTTPQVILPGRVISHVDSVSALYEHLFPGTLVTALDDTPLWPINGTHDVWTLYLTSFSTPTQGWCVSNSWYLEQPLSTCCDPTRPTSTLTCFVSIPPPTMTLPSQLRCLDPVPVLTRPPDVDVRCESSDQCGDQDVCVLPREGDRLMRLRVRAKEGKGEEVVLWSGPRSEVLDHVHVGPNYFEETEFFLLSGLKHMVGYLRIAALSLGLFNLLPLPFLDGSALLGALLETIKVEVEMDPEDGRTRAGRGDRTRRAVKRAVEGLTCTLSIVCLLLGIWRAI